MSTRSYYPSVYPSVRHAGPGREQGVTLIELLVVLVLLGVASLMIFPRIPYLDGFVLNSEARRVAGFLRYIEDSASTRKTYFKVFFYPEKEGFKVESSTDGLVFKELKGSVLGAFTLKGGTDMQDVVVAGLGKISKGNVAVVFNPSVGAEPFNLHLERNGRVLTLSYNPYSGKVKVMEGYI